MSHESTTERRGRPPIPTEELLGALRGLANRLGKTPTTKECEDDSQTAAARTYRRRFGSWREVCEAAGLEYTERRGSRAKTERNAEMVHLHTKERITLAQIGEHYDVSRERVRQIVRKAGVPVDFTRKITDAHRGITESDGLDALRELAEKLEKTPRGPDIDDDPHCPSLRWYVRHFGSLTEARAWAGLPRTLPHPTKITDDELIDSLRNLARRLGHTPTIREMNADPQSHFHTTYARRWGSWADACRAAGLVPNSIGGPGHTPQPLPEDFLE